MGCSGLSRSQGAANRATACTRRRGAAVVVQTRVHVCPCGECTGGTRGVTHISTRLSRSGALVTGSAHVGAPTYDSTLRFDGTTVSGTQLDRRAGTGDGSFPFVGTLSADGQTMTDAFTSRLRRLAISMTRQ